jgi:hypothetical protein
MKKKSILIVGDSWGKGEMGGNHTIAHPGVNLYLSDLGYEVLPKAYSGGSNRLSVKEIQQNPCDFIVFFFTDPTRDYQNFKNPYWAKEEKDVEFRYPPLHPFPEHLNYRELWLHQRQSILNSLIQYNNKLLLIGGNTRIEKIARSMGFLHSTDWVDHIAPGNQFPEIWGEIRMIAGQEKWIAKQTDLLEDGKEKYYKTMAKYEVFWISGFHPDRRGHKIITDWIHKTIQSISQ